MYGGIFRRTIFFFDKGHDILIRVHNNVTCICRGQDIASRKHEKISLFRAHQIIVKTESKGFKYTTLQLTYKFDYLKF